MSELGVSELIAEIILIDLRPAGAVVLVWVGCYLSLFGLDLVSGTKLEDLPMTHAEIGTFLACERRASRAACTEAA